MGFYQLGNWVVMPNHVHALVLPFMELPRVIAGIKSVSARQANCLLRRPGAFWAKDYFDRWIRDSAAEFRIARYIEGNPVKAGFCTEPEDWRFSSAHDKRGW